MSSISSDSRFTTPLFTSTEVARHLGIPKSTVRNWLGLSDAPSIVTHIAETLKPRDATVPFVGLTEAFVLSAFRQSGLPLQRIRPAVARLAEDVNLPHALANRRVMTDGAEILYDYGRDHDASIAKDLVVVRSQQIVFREVVESYLRCITWAEDEYSTALRLPSYGEAQVIVDPDRSFGQPIFGDVGVRLEDVLDLFFAGESIDVVAEEYGVHRSQVEAAVRVAGRQRALAA